MALGLPHDSPMIFLDTKKNSSCAMAAPELASGTTPSAYADSSDRRISAANCQGVLVQHGSYFGACILYFIFSLRSGPWIPNRLSSFVPFLYMFLLDTTKQVHTATHSDLPSNFTMFWLCCFVKHPISLIHSAGSNFQSCSSMCLRPTLPYSKLFPEPRAQRESPARRFGRW